MRIISKPKPVSEYRSTCHAKACRTTVGMEPGDCHRFHDRDGGSIVWKCPSCGRDNFVSVEVVPEGFVSQVK